MSEISIIVRTKNEEDWIGLCLKAISEQTLSDQVEVVLVDNDSTDRTVEKAMKVCPNLVFVNISKYVPGTSLNMGIEAASGKIIVCLSAHCVPANEFWLENLVKELDSDDIAGVYGRQIPLESSEDKDSRDLWITFGLDRKVQIKDPFFHNASSAFRKSIWEESPFDETLKHLEDRVWGQLQVSKGRKLVYTPDSVVFHHHGIHQNGDNKRADGVVDVMKSLHAGITDYENFDDPFRNQKSLLVVPISQRYSNVDESAFLHDIEKIREENELFDIVILSDSERVQQIALKEGFLSPYVRNHESAESIPPLIEDIGNLLEFLEDSGEYYDNIAISEMIYPNRRRLLFTQMLKNMRQIGADSIVAAWPEKRPVMVESQTGKKERYDDFSSSLAERRPVYIAVPGLGVILKPELIRQKVFFSDSSAIFEIDEWSELIENRSSD